MGLLNWLFYILIGIILFFIVEFISTKYKISKLDKIVISIIMMIILSGFCFRIGIRFTENIFLIFVFMMVTDIIFNTYVLDNDFFDKDERRILYYIVLVILGFFINQEFINKVTDVFLTGSDMRIVVWLLVVIYLYSLIKNRNVFNNESNKTKEKNFMSINSILNSYAKLKYLYYDDCDCDDRELSNMLYAIMIYENKKRNKIQRSYDNYIFRINGKKANLGIMQVESKKFITDSESINIVYKKLLKLYSKNDSNNYSVIDSYYGYDNKEVKYIFDIIKKF